MNLKTIKFIKENNNWEELLEQAPYFLTIKEDEHYYLLKYNQIESDFSNEIVKECRGLIIDKQTLEPVALSFRKFHNVQEPIHDDIDWITARVQEKIDGSKLLLFYNKYDSKWQVCTSGNLDAYKANVNDFEITFGDLYEKALKNNNLTKQEFEDKLDIHYCYTFELVSPESRVVIPYKEADLYFIGIRNIISFNEDLPIYFASYLGIKTPKEYSLKTLDDCLKATDIMGYDEEGFVVVDDNWNRVKIKSPAYVSIHHLRDNGVVNKRRILDLINHNGQDDYLAMFPEYTEYFNEVLSKRYNFINRLIKGYRELREFAQDNIKANRKDFAIWITSNYKDISTFLFNCLNIGLENEYELHKWFESLPVDKQLEYLYKE